MPTGDGAWIQGLNASDIADQGTMLTLQNSSAIPCVYYSDFKQFQKVVQIDGDDPGRSQMVGYFIVDGTQLSNVAAGQSITFNGIEYVIKDPIWPNWLQGVCTLVGLVGYIP